MVETVVGFLEGYSLAPADVRPLWKKAQGVVRKHSDGLDHELLYDEDLGQIFTIGDMRRLARTSRC